MGLHCKTCQCDGDLSDPGMDDVGAYHKNGQRTEKEAAYAVMPRSGTQRLRVLEYLIACGSDGTTDNEMEIALRMCRPSPGTRRLELGKGGWVYDTGRERITENGKPAIVWAVTPGGLARYREALGLEQPAVTRRRRTVTRTPREAETEPSPTHRVRSPRRATSHRTRSR